MANGIADENFKEDMLRLMKFAVLKIGENSKEIALLRKDLDKNTKNFKSLRKDIRANAGLDADVKLRVLEMYNRLLETENQVNSLAD